MVPLYAARIEDLGPGDYIRVQGTACGHDELLMSDQLRIKGVSLPPYTPVLDFERRPTPVRSGCGKIWAGQVSSASWL
jgi:hypothetical protein